MKYYFITLLFFWCKIAISQCKVTILDSSTFKPISEVYIYTVDNSLEYYTNELGVVSLKNCNQKFLIFKYGYLSKERLQLSNSDTILLLPLTINLNQVTISNSIERYREFSLGNHNHFSISSNKLKLDSGFIYSSIIDNLDSILRIKKIIYSVRSNCEKVRIKSYIFNVDNQNHSPTDIIFSKDTTVLLNNKISININQLHLKVPSKKLHLGLELFEKEPATCSIYLKINKKNENYYSYIKFKDHWKQLKLGLDEVWNLNQGLIIEK